MAKTKAKTSAEDLDKLMEIAKDPSATGDQLKKVWKSTVSPKIRKQIALNANADLEVMKMAARLYLKELLSNPSFELIEIFLDDPFVKAVQKAYKSPPSNGHVGYEKGVNGERDRMIVQRALLLSPHLNYASLENCSKALPTAVFKRELKDPVIYNKVKSLVNSKFASLQIKKTATTLLCNSPCVDLFEKSSQIDDDTVAWAYRYAELGIVSESEIHNIVYAKGLSRSMYHVDPAHIRHIMSNLKSSSGKKPNIDSATRSILVGGKHCAERIGDLILDPRKGANYLSHKGEILASLSEVMVNISELYTEYGWDRVTGSMFNLPFKLYKAIVKAVVESSDCQIKKGHMLNVNESNYEYIYNKFMSLGFNRYAPIFYQRMFCIEGLKSYQSLANCSPDVQKFFILNGFVDRGVPISEATASTVAVIDEINESGPIEKAIFKFVGLDYYKMVIYNCEFMRFKLADHCGISHDLLPCVDIKGNQQYRHSDKSISTYKSTADFVNRLLRRI